MMSGSLIARVSMNAPSNVANTWSARTSGSIGIFGGCDLCRATQLLCETLAPGEDGVDDDVVRAVLEELLLEDVRDVQTARLLRGHLVGGILESADELNDLHRRVVTRRLRLGHELLEERDIARGIAFDESAREVVLAREVVEERALARLALREDRVDRRRGEAVFEDEALRAVEDPLACLRSASGHDLHRSWTCNRLVGLL